MSTDNRLKIALIGLGRLGAIRSQILVSQQPRIQLVAVCDTKPGSDKWAAENLPAAVKYYADPKECMEKSGAQAVLISTATATHAPLVCMALDYDLVSEAKVECYARRRKLTASARHVRETHFRRYHHYFRSPHQGRDEAQSKIPCTLLPALSVKI